MAINCHPVHTSQKLRENRHKTTIRRKPVKTPSPGRHKQFIIIKYEELVKNTINNTKKLFDFLDLPYTSQTEQFIKKSHQRHNHDPYSVYKSKKVKDRWKRQLDKKIKSEILEELKDTKFERFLN